MSTTLANPVEMIKKGAPHVIHSDAELEEYTKVLFELTAKSRPTREEEEAAELLTLLIERYESERYPVLDAEPADVLRFLLDQNGLSQRDIAADFGGESTVSLVLAGKRRLNRNHIERLSRRFHVSPSVFFSAAKGADLRRSAPAKRPAGWVKPEAYEGRGRSPASSAGASRRNNS